VPTHNSFGPDDGYGIKNARKATIEPNEQGAVGPAQIQSTWCALSKHVQLMTQNQKFGVKPPGWEAEAATWHSVADVDSLESMAEARDVKRQMKAVKQPK